MDGCALVSHQRGLEPRDRRVPARDGPLRDAPRDRRLPGGDGPGAARSLLDPRRHRAGSRASPGAGSRSCRRSSGTRSITSRSRWVPRRGAIPPAWPEERKAKGRALLTAAHRGLLAAAPLGVLAVPWRGSLRAKVAQAAAIALVVALAIWALASDESPFWPLAVVIPFLAALPLPGAPKGGRGILAYAAFVVASVCVTHAVFFGEDRYHVVATPVLCLLAACALRSPLAPSAGPSSGSLRACSEHLADR